MPSGRFCPLCDLEADYLDRNPPRDGTNVECRRCGRFFITSQAQTALTEETKSLLSAYARRVSAGNNRVDILSTNIQHLIASLPQYSPAEKLDNLLQLIAERTSSLGEDSQFDLENDYPLLVLRDPGELDYLIQALYERDFLKGTQDGVHVTMAGWDRVEEIRRIGRSSSRTFVAMWFDASMDEVYATAIEPAIRQAGYESLRIDKSEHVNRIDDEIIGQIRRARFMVADFTGQRHGVYFEAGMMLGLGRNVIWMSRREEFEEGSGLHFDVRQFNFIVYDNVEDAKTQLYNRILAIEGEGPLVA
jgi:hypothetical protein